jgi:cell division transport system ATP-binding protein
MIRIEGLTKKYGSRTILDDINLEITPGEFITITGPSGSGKSTLVHLLMGADEASSGKILIDDIDIGALTTEQLQNYRRTIGVIFQDYKLLPKISVFDNVAYALEVTDAPHHEIVKRVPIALERVGMHKHMDHFPNQLSGGEMQRVALARALAHEPELIIADEPTGNLDPENTARIMDHLLELHKNGATIILTTHDPSLVEKTPGRVLGLLDGSMEAKQ